MAAKPVGKGCAVTADRGMVLALPDTANSGVLFGSGLLVPHESIKKVSSGMFELSGYSLALLFMSKLSIWLQLRMAFVPSSSAWQTATSRR